MSATVAIIQRFPVKGLSAQALPAVELCPDQGLPGDRRYAIAHGASAFDPLAPAWQPKSNFVTLSRTARLASLEADYDPEAAVLVIRRSGRQVARGALSSPIGRQLIEQFLDAYLKDDCPGMPRLVDAPGVMFSDRREPLVSIINAASLRDLERVVKQPVDPVRFRSNFVIDGVAAWAETGWVGRSLTLGAARLEVVRPIVRCSSINIDPASGADLPNIQLALQRGYGTDACGVYARVSAGGTVRCGDPVELLPSA
jgi:uncharacterized protein YcbX